MIRKGLHEAVKEYLQAPLVSTLPCPEFLIDGPLASSSSVQLETGLCQMSEVVMAMLDQALSDQGSLGTSQGKIATLNKWKEYKFNDKIFYSYADCYPQEGGT